MIKYDETCAGTRAAEAFENTYKKPPENTVFTPYRICPIGAHSDHQLGKVTGFAIDKGRRRKTDTSAWLAENSIRVARYTAARTNFCTLTYRAADTNSSRPLPI